MTKIDPRPARPPARDLRDERYWDPRDLEAEMRRTLEVCHNCRMCVGYCGTFPDVFRRVDRDIETRGATGAELLDAEAFAHASELCWQCKLCYVKCPYTQDEGHEWAIDVPRLLLREKAQRARRAGVTIQDRVLGEPQALGRLGAGPLAPAINFIHRNRLVRRAMQASAGIAADFPLPSVAQTSFESWLARHEPAAQAGRRGAVSLFATCLGDYNVPSIAASAVRVLEANGWSVSRPPQTCCGMPNLDGGDVASAQAKAAANVWSLSRELDLGRRLVTLQPTCAYVIRKEWPELLGSDAARRVAEAAVDVMSLLDEQRRDATLSRAFARGLGRIAYHAACHLRAQKIGYPALPLLRLVPDTTVSLVEHCSAVDGTWGMKAQHYEMGRRYAQKLVREVDALEPELVLTDCALSAQRILAENGRLALHPIEALARAYGLGPEPEFEATRKQ